MTTMIDMHAHWKPAEIADALRARSKEPRILRNQDGAEVLKSRMSEEPLATVFDDVQFHLGRMDRQGVETSVLSLLGSFCWTPCRRARPHPARPEGLRVLNATPTLLHQSNGAQPLEKGQRFA